MLRFLLIVQGTATNEIAFKQMLQLHNFGVKMGSEHLSVEKAAMWCGRLAIEGSREVAMVSIVDLQAHMKAAGIVGIDARTYFKDIRTEGVKKAADNGVRFYHATLGAGDYLFTPANFLTREKVNADADVFGIRYSFLLPRDKAGLGFFSNQAGAITTTADHPSKMVLKFSAE